MASVGIVVTHVAFQTATDSPLLARFDYFVAVFFALSAFLLTRGTPRAPREYYARRVERIVPAYLVSVVVILLVLPPLSTVNVGPVLANLTLTQIYVPGGLIDGLTQHWSLCVEVAFYAVLPLYVALAPRWRWWALAAALAAALVWPFVIPQDAAVNLQIWPVSYVPWFAVGLVCAELERRGVGVWGPRWVWPCVSLLVAWVGGVVGPPGLEHPSPAEFSVRVLLGAVFAACWVVPFALAPRASGTVLASPPLLAVGRWSYSLFLWHMAVLHFVFPLLGLPLFDGHFALVLVVTLGLSVVVSYVSYELVERPALRVLRSLRR